MVGRVGPTGNTAAAPQAGYPRATASTRRALADLGAEPLLEHLRPARVEDRQGGQGAPSPERSLAAPRAARHAAPR